MRNSVHVAERVVTANGQHGAEAPGNYTLVLSDRIEHLHTLEKMLKEKAPWINIEILTGRMNKKKRAAIMKQAQARQVEVFLATQLAREGLNLPHLNRLFFCTPKRAAGAVQQEIGRIMRQTPGSETLLCMTSGMPVLHFSKRSSGAGGPFTGSWG